MPSSKALREKRFFSHSPRTLAIRATTEIPADPRANSWASLRIQSETFIDSERWALFIHASSE